MRIPRHLLPVVILASVAGGLAGLPPALTAQAAPGAADPLRLELDEVRHATAKYRDIDAAVRDGYVRARIGADFPLMGEHWVNRELLDRPLDLLHPAILQYVQVDGVRVLVGVAYGQWTRAGEPLPDGFTGDADRWHTHAATLLAQARTARPVPSVRSAAQRLSGGAPSGADEPAGLAMLHVWLWSRNPDGVFANRNPALPYLRAGLPEAWARPEDEAAPRAVGLLVPGGCGALIDRLEWLLGAGPFPASALADECDRAAERVGAALRGGAGGDAFNAIAASAWLDFVAGAREAIAPGGLTESEADGGIVSATRGAAHAH